MLDVRRTGSVYEVIGSLDDDGGRALLAALRTCDGDVRIDGSGLEAIDGAGFTALVLARRQCRSEGREFELVTVAPMAVSGLRAGRQLPSLFAGPPPRRPVAAAAADVPATSDAAGRPQSGDDRSRRRRVFRRHFSSRTTHG